MHKISNKLNEKFNKILIYYLYQKLKNTLLNNDIINNYIYEIKSYINEEKSFKEKIIERAIELID